MKNSASLRVMVLLAVVTTLLGARSSLPQASNGTIGVILETERGEIELALDPVRL